MRPRAGHRGWTDICPGAAHGNGEVADNEVASHPLSANLAQKICAENPNLATLVSEVTAVAKEAVAIPGELLDEALQALRRVGSRSAAAEEAETFEIEVRRDVSCAELAQAQNYVVRESISPTDEHRQ